MQRKDQAQKENLGWKKTQIRTAILDILSAAKHPLSVSDLKEKLQIERSRPNKTTLYRDLELFLREKLVSSVEFGDGKARYELTDRGHHHHLICQSCEKIEDVTLSKDLEVEEERIMRIKNFKILQHSLEFYGLCGSCQVKK